MRWVYMLIFPELGKFRLCCDYLPKTLIFLGRWVIIYLLRSVSFKHMPLALGPTIIGSL
jgi:hypothetical protein